MGITGTVAEPKKSKIQKNTTGFIQVQKPFVVKASKHFTKSDVNRLVVYMRSHPINAKIVSDFKRFRDPKKILDQAEKFKDIKPILAARLFALTGSIYFYNAKGTGKGLENAYKSFDTAVSILKKKVHMKNSNRELKYITSHRDGVKGLVVSLRNMGATRSQKQRKAKIDEVAKNDSILKYLKGFSPPKDVANMKQINDSFGTSVRQGKEPSMIRYGGGPKIKLGMKYASLDKKEAKKVTSEDKKYDKQSIINKATENNTMLKYLKGFSPPKDVASTKEINASFGKAVSTKKKPSMIGYGGGPKIKLGMKYASLDKKEAKKVASEDKRKTISYAVKSFETNLRNIEKLSQNGELNYDQADKFKHKLKEELAILKNKITKKQQDAFLLRINRVNGV